ncbi:SDR family NAD(P)-dependent oxidoreductase [Streptomyces sp. NBC_01476]|uniref:SDR family NAD(P)-dependent oxidoreductase n=1 Tax=Streptomyces sp. NBC_01476 TaxID=2903881 RepID=UPI002E34A074|nr:SDR family NAD(P)-dependent oxidoreductase [Streptomyces sp. NBC_01476]
MSRVLITGSSDGLGLMTAKLLAEQGHKVTLHARNSRRAQDAGRALPEAEAVVTGDLSSVHETREVAEQVNALGRYDAVIHNAGVGFRERHRVTDEGVAHTFAVNVLAPYLLTALVDRPARLVYLSSAMHYGGNPDLSDLGWSRRRWDPAQAYSDSKLFDVTLAFAVARRWPDVLSNSLTPGWVATRMGGRGAPDDLSLAPVTQAWLAVSDDAEARVSGRYFYHQRQEEAHPAAGAPAFQDELLDRCAALTGTPLPGDRAGS